MARTFDIQGFLKEHKVAKKDEANLIKQGKAKVCTREGCPCGNVALKVDAFYRDKSQASGRSPWCKVAEREYNRTYYANLKKAGVARLSDIPAAKAPKKVAVKATKKSKVKVVA